MTTGMWTKKETQQTLRELRKAGYAVANDDGFYTVTIPGEDSGKSYLTAMVDTDLALVLVRYDPSLFGKG
jgi:hypothetical protein